MSMGLGVVSSVLGVMSVAGGAAAQEPIHFTYLWHLEQPIYWPDQSRLGGSDRYEYAWDSIRQTDAGALNPENNLRDIFGKDDRVAVYQWRVRDAINDIRWAPEAGAQVSYSGGLIQNIKSLGQANQLGYGPGWAGPYREARGWRTSGASKPRLDMVVFPFHHALMPLVAESTMRKEIQAYQHVYLSTWGNAAPVSRGFFPSEMAFSTRMVRILDEEGIDWSVVSAEKISRATQDFPVVLGSGGVNCDPPNRADMINPPAGDYYRVQISRGCAPAEAVPLSLTPHRVQAVDPNDDPQSPTVFEIVAIPASQSVSWEDGYSPIGTQHLDQLQSFNGADRPMLVTLAHDGDNAFGGGYSYYREATPNLVSAAQSKGYSATVVEEYLADHPVPADAVVHVEDGAWVNADGDFGSPQFWNWNYPPVNAQGQVDIENGWAEDIRNWAVITAAQNHVDTAEQISLDAGQQVRIGQIVEPDASATPTERAWHFFLGALNSGYMYYGTALDFEVKPAIACNEALQHTAPVLASGVDRTPPTIWIPQRWPWNPGEMNYGSPYGYQPTVMGTDFHVWTFVHDVSDVQRVTLRYRVDADGLNPLGDWQNETYTGGSDVGSWVSIEMTQRQFPQGNFFNDPELNFFEQPGAIADQYFAQITGLSESLVDYYVESEDANGNIARSPIQHVWIGDGEGAVTPGDDRVSIDPEQPAAGDSVVVRFDAAGGPLAGAQSAFLYWGINDWASVQSTNTPMSLDASTGLFETTIQLPSNTSQLDIVFNNGDGVFDNNGGQDWHFAVEGSTNEPQMFTVDGSLDSAYTQVASGAGTSLHAGLQGSTLYLAGSHSQLDNDQFILWAETPGPLQPAMWAKAGQVAAWDAFVGSEESNGFNGWFGANGQTAVGNVLEASTVLPQSVLDAGVIHLAFASYATADGGSLEQQAPAGDGDADLEASEWVRVELCDLTEAGCDEPCLADVNADGSLNGLDFGAWLGAYNTADPAADQNGDGSINGLDFGAWLANFNAGCD